MHFPEPVIDVAIEPKSKVGRGEDGRRRCSACPRRIRRSASARTRRRARRSSPGMGELHLEIIVDRMMREFNVEANVGKPQVAYRETISQARPSTRHALRAPDGRQRAVRGRHGVDRAAGAPGKGFVFENEIVGGAIPQGVHPGGREGRRGGDGERRPGRLSGGRRQGELDGRVRTTKSTRRKWRSRSRGSMAFKEAGRKAKPQPARADHGRRGGRARGVHGRRHRRPVVAPRTHRRHVPARRRAGRSRRRCRSRRCSVTRRACARSRRAARSTRCSSRATKTLPASMAEEIVAKAKG